MSTEERANELYQAAREAANDLQTQFGDVVVIVHIVDRVDFSIGSASIAPNKKELLEVVEFMHSAIETGHIQPNLRLT